MITRHTLTPLLWAACAAAGTVAGAAADKPPQPPARPLKAEMGITPLSDEQMKWILDAKFGMFIQR